MSDPGPQRAVPSSIGRLRAQHAYICKYNSELMIERMGKDKKFMLGRMLRGVRREAGKSLLDLSDALAVSVSEASRIENGDLRKITVDLIIKWLDCCGASDQLDIFLELYQAI